MASSVFHPDWTKDPLDNHLRGLLFNADFLSILIRASFQMTLDWFAIMLPAMTHHAKISTSKTPIKIVPLGRSDAFNWAQNLIRLYRTSIPSIHQTTIRTCFWLQIVTQKKFCRLNHQRARTYRTHPMNLMRLLSLALRRWSGSTLIFIFLWVELK